MDDNRIRVNMLPEDSDKGYGLDAGKLYAVIGKLVLENRIRLSVNPFFKDIEKLQSVAFLLRVVVTIQRM